MKLEILSIGTEVVLGSIVNTNASFLAKQLTLAHYEVTRTTALPDDAAALLEELTVLFDRTDLLIVTGGLGPTTDDRTRKVFAEFFETSFTTSKEVADEIAKRFGKDLPSLSDQSLVPKDAKVFVNPMGTAPGLALSKGKKTAILLPGVPKEMEAIFIGQVLSYLKKTYPPKAVLFHQEYHLCLLTESDIDPFLRKLEMEMPDLEVGIYPHYGTICVRFSSKVEKQIKIAAEKYFKEFETYIYSDKSPKIEIALQNWMIENHKTFSAAESFTGGSLSAAVTKVPDASKYFLGSLVTYSNSMKETLLHVDKKTIENYGAVSSETAQEMLYGLLKETGADYGVALTGIAGPSGGSDAKPVGTAWVAMGRKDEPPYVSKWQLRGDREVIMESGVNRSLGVLWRWVKHGVDPFLRKHL